VEPFQFPVLLGTPGLSKFECSLHFDDDQDPYFELKAEGTAKKEQQLCFLQEEEVLLISETTALFSKETVTAPPGMEMLVDTKISKRIVLMPRNGSTKWDLCWERIGIFSRCSNVLAIAKFDKEVVIRAQEIAAYAVL